MSPPTARDRTDPAALSAAVKAEAARLGFVACGVLPAGPVATHAFYEAWLAAGYAGAMGYLHRHAPLKRDPRALLPEARSVIVLAHPDGAGSGAPAPATDALRGRVSRYALGPDYHGVLWDKLERLAGFLAGQLGHPLRHRACVDTAPLMERELAARAGLGWVGRNGLLITWRRGSWVLLGELLVDAHLAPDLPPPPRSGWVPPARNGRPPPLPQAAQVAPHALTPPLRDACGNCTACLDACPTGAIVGDRTVDSRRCISYLTIELKGPIPRELRPGLGDWVFGCDVCQAVCPWNGPRADHAPKAPEAEPARATPELPDLLVQDDAAFRARFRTTALWRPRRRGVLRNAAIALGNRLAGRAGPPPARTLEGARPALETAVVDSEPLVRGAAAWALGQAARAGHGWGLKALRTALATEPDGVARGELEAAIRDAGGS